MEFQSYLTKDARRHHCSAMVLLILPQLGLLPSPLSEGKSGRSFKPSYLGTVSPRTFLIGAASLFSLLMNRE